MVSWPMLHLFNSNDDSDVPRLLPQALTILSFARDASKFHFSRGSNSISARFQGVDLQNSVRMHEKLMLYAFRTM
jgi:hypothetical protein